MKLIAPYKLYESATFKPLTDIINLADAKRTWDNGVVTVEITDDSLVDIPTVKGWIAGGGEIEDLPVFFSFTSTAYGKDVPEGFPERSYEDEEGNTVIRKWSEWKSPNHEHNVIGNLTYVPSNSWGYELTGAQIVAFDALAGVNTLTADEYKALLPTETE